MNLSTQTTAVRLSDGTHGRAARSLSAEHARPSAASAWQRATETIARVDNRLMATTEGAGALQTAARYQLASGGKRFRARLSLALSFAGVAPLEEAVEVASALELLHNASLVHDDLQDRDQVRRFQPTVWKQFGDETALLLGDWMHSRSYQLLLSDEISPGNRDRLLSRFLEATRVMILGQSMEAGFHPAQVSLGDYEQAACGKSGALLALAAESGLIISRFDETQAADAARAVSLLGIAYQIRDDLCDLHGLKEGRPAGSDVAHGRLTAPVIAHLRLNPATASHMPSLERVQSDSRAMDLVDQRFRLLLRTATTLIDGLPAAAAGVLRVALEQLFPEAAAWPDQPTETAERRGVRS